MSEYTCRSTVDVTKSGHSDGVDESDDDDDENSTCRDRCGLQLGIRQALARDAPRFADDENHEARDALRSAVGTKPDAKLGSLENARHRATGGLIFLEGVLCSV